MPRLVQPGPRPSHDPSGLPQQLFDGIHWRHHYPLGLDAADGLRHNACNRLLAEVLRNAFTGYDQCAAPSFVPGAFPR